MDDSVMESASEDIHLYQVCPAKLSPLDWLRWQQYQVRLIRLAIAHWGLIGILRWDERGQKYGGQLIQSRNKALCFVWSTMHARNLMLIRAAQ